VTARPLVPPREWRLWLAGEAVAAEACVPLHDRFDGAAVARVPQASPAQAHAAIAAAVASRPAMAALSSHQRRAILHGIAARIEARAEEFARTAVAECGKPIRDARAEVGRMLETLRTGAEEAARIGGEVMPLDLNGRSTGRLGITRRVPAGVAVFVTPFNFPLNLAAHKIAPAIAAGCPWVLKPAPQTPLSALLLGEVLAEAGLPAGSWSILPAPNEVAQAMVEHPAPRLFSFTGSVAVGWRLKALAGRKRVILELGGNAPCIVDEGADLDLVAPRVAFGAFYQSGQTCISVQRIIVHRSLAEELRARLVAEAAKLVSGDPAEEATFLGPLIDEAAATRVRTWVTEAIAEGARLLCGGGGSGAFVEPTLLDHVPTHTRLYREEAFGPVAVIEEFGTFDEAIDRANDSAFGLQCGLFTDRLPHVRAAWDRIETGALIVGDIPSWRVDAMPYGGVKDSGLGREGLRAAIEEMTEPRLLVLP
jgi:acyl-CoA reductase-like NAD-dependent aldehyde dehydrogenase